MIFRDIRATELLLREKRFSKNILCKVIMQPAQHNK